MLEMVVPEINKDVDTLFVSMKRFLNTLYDMPDSILHCAASNIGNKVINIFVIFLNKQKHMLYKTNIVIYIFQCNQIEFHLFHMHIELRWFFITLIYSRTIWYQYQTHTLLEEFENTTEMVINDFMHFALKVFERVITIM